MFCSFALSKRASRRGRSHRTIRDKVQLALVLKEVRHDDEFCAHLPLVRVIGGHDTGVNP